MKFNECLKMYRMRAGLTQAELANKLMVSPATISKYEVGSVCPDIKILELLSSILNVSPSELLGLENASSSKTCPTEYTIDEVELLELYKQLPDKYKYEIKGYLRGIVSSHR